MTPRASASPPAIDDIFRALSDPTRRDVVERLSAGQASVSDLAAPYRMALPSFVAHLRVLEGCGLVTSHKRGRVRTYSLAPQQLKFAEDWLGRQRKLWEARLDRLDAYLLKLKEEKPQ
ncbi:helix-turn-helix transcriptional regulator [Novosphingobium sp. G106]|uniref:ArsR/SmtB family transcription factor n=1 Tax=Novosphingobium sp. G106 TaxID=2849500 RepID=UPI0020C5A79A|nr:metalloregulator ArsR/SmtB family transcription factor [Novosphingobium sp. G106]